MTRPTRPSTSVARAAKRRAKAFEEIKKGAKRLDQLRARVERVVQRAAKRLRELDGPASAPPPASPQKAADEGE
jgi:hypothetical protein